MAEGGSEIIGVAVQPCRRCGGVDGPCKLGTFHVPEFTLGAGRQWQPKQAVQQQ